MSYYFFDNFLLSMEGSLASNYYCSDGDYSFASRLTSVIASLIFKANYLATSSISPTELFFSSISTGGLSDFILFFALLL